MDLEFTGSTLFIHTLRIFASLCLIILSGCAKGGSSETSLSSKQAFIPTCGARVENDLVLSGHQGVMREVAIQAIGDDLILVNFKSATTNKPFLIQLEGISTTHLSLNQKALLRETIAKYSSGLFIINEPNPCSFNASDESPVIAAQLVRYNEENQIENLSEKLLSLGLAKPAVTHCGDNILSDCLQALPVKEINSAQTISRVHWNPESKLTGKLEILTDAYNVRIAIKGKLSSRSKFNEGPTGEYPSTARFNYGGCAYGNSKVYFYDEYDRPIKLADGSAFLRITNSCEKRTFNF